MPPSGQFSLASLIEAFLANAAVVRGRPFDSLNRGQEFGGSADLFIYKIVEANLLISS